MCFSIFPIYFSLLVVATLKTKRTALVLIDGKKGKKSYATGGPQLSKFFLFPPQSLNEVDRLISNN